MAYVLLSESYLNGICYLAYNKMAVLICRSKAIKDQSKNGRKFLIAAYFSDQIFLIYCIKKHQALKTLYKFGL